MAAGPFVGEFGYELFDWQGYLRTLASTFDRVIISTRPGHEALYTDFCQEFRPYFSPTPACVGRKNFITSLPEIVSKDVFADMKDPRIIKLPGGQQFRDTAPKYIRYGVASPELKYDVVLHARSLKIVPKTKLGLSATMRALKEARNWLPEYWVELVGLLPGFRICSIGAIDGALHVPGTENLLGKPLRELVNVLASSTVTVGPSSGAMHLATLCGCPQVVWFDQDAAAGPANLNARYTHDWNPFGAYVELISDSWKPTPVRVADAIKRTFELLSKSPERRASTPVPVGVPA